MNKVALSVLLMALYYWLLSIFDPGLSPSAGFLFALVYVFVPIVFLPLLVGAAAVTLKGRNEFTHLKTKLARSGFTTTHDCTAGQSGVLFDSKSRRICVFSFSPSGEIEHWDLPFTGVLGTSIAKDDLSIVKVSTGSAVGRALVGGILLGGVGAIIGGVTASSSERTKVKRLVLEIVLDCPQHPVHRMAFLDFPEGLDERAPPYRKLARDLEFLQLLLELIIFCVDIPAAKSTEDLADIVKMIKLKSERDAQS